MKKNGFTLVEVILAMFIVAAVMAASYAAFITLSKSFKRQAKSSETIVESILGLDLLRYDIEMAGFGLPRGTTRPLMDITYSEAEPSSAYTDRTNFMPEKYTPDPSCFNDTTSPSCTCSASTLSCITDIYEPRAVILADDENPGQTSEVNDDSDVLVIKSLTASINDESGKWALRFNDGIAADPYNQAWGSSGHDLEDDYLVIVQSSIDKILQCTGGSSPPSCDTSSTWYFTIENWDSTDPPDSNNDSGLPDPNTDILYMTYGVDINTTEKPLNLRMPFNRVDYYLQRDKTNFPTRCHPSSYSLVRATIGHDYQSSPDSDDNGMRVEMPVLDCVVDFQVALGVDSDGDGDVDTWEYEQNSATLGDAQSISQNLMSIKVFILMHEGYYDPDFTYEATGNEIEIGVDENDDGDLDDTNDLTLKTYDLTKLSNWENYRWKLIKVTVKTVNLDG